MLRLGGADFLIWVPTPFVVPQTSRAMSMRCMCTALPQRFDYLCVIPSWDACSETPFLFLAFSCPCDSTPIYAL